eukprot:scaffold32771_cov65-Cyclotella_meneghiniana.AAC.4
MSIYPRMFRVFVTKMVSHFCGTNLQLYRYGETDSDACPSCGQPEESSSHITRCKDPGRSQMFDESADLLIEWLQDTHLDSDLIKCIDAYLQSRGEDPMCDIASSFPQYSKIAEDIDALGWECFLEGRIPQSLVDYQKLSLRQSDSFWKIRTWSSNCVQYLLNITHRQWLYRNARIYLKKLDGMTTEEHLEVIDLVKGIPRTYYRVTDLYFGLILSNWAKGAALIANSGLLKCTLPFWPLKLHQLYYRQMTTAKPTLNPRHTHNWRLATMNDIGNGLGFWQRSAPTWPNGCGCDRPCHQLISWSALHLFGG